MGLGCKVSGSPPHNMTRVELQGYVTLYDSYPKSEILNRVHAATRF